MGELHNTYADSACNYIVHALNTLGTPMDGRHTTLNRMFITMASIFVLVVIMGTASATDYYLATGGDDRKDGTSLETAWKTPSYAVRQLHPGATLWVVDGTYYGSTTSELKGNNVGNETHWVRIKAYNGTPVWDGGGAYRSGFKIHYYPYDEPYKPGYIELDGIHIKSYGYDEVLIRNLRNVIIKNCTFSNSSIAYPTWTSLMDLGAGVRDITIDNCTFIDSGDFGINIIGDRYNDGTKTYNVSVTNCYFEKTLNHHGVQITDYASDITVVGNTFVDCHHGAGTYIHEWNAQIPHAYNILIKDNIFEDINCYALFAFKTDDSLYINNTINSSSGNAAATVALCNNVTFKDNKVANSNALVDHSRRDRPNVFVTYENFMHAGGRAPEDYKLWGGGTIVVRNDVNQPESRAYLSEGTIGIFEYTDGRVFDCNIFGNAYSITGPKWYMDKSNFTLESSDPVSVDLMYYNITLRPTYGHLHDVTVDAWDEATDTYRITANSTEPNNPTWINLTTQSTSATYNIARDGKSYTSATTGADSVLRYRYLGAWTGLHTFEFSHASDEVDPAPCVTKLRNDTPTQNTTTLRWDCSAPDIDHYTIHRDGVLIDTTVNQYYHATNLVPDTTYTFEVSANKDGITSDSVSITVKTAAEEAGDLDNNVVIIDNNAAAHPKQSVAMPIIIKDATEVACYGLNLTYNASVVTVTDVTQGDFTTYFGFDNESAADGWVTVNTYVSENSLNGSVKIAEVTLTAVGDAGDTSSLDMEIISVADQNGHPVSGTVSNGMFTVVNDTSPPGVTDLSASQLIPDDTDGVPSWGETATLNVTVTDESDIAGVTIDLSVIGGSSVQPMTHIGNNIWSVTTNASAGTPPRTYNLAVCATDIHGYINMQESVELVVMRNGDVTGDNELASDDVTLLANYVTYPGRYTISSEFVADVTDDGVVTIADAMLLANYVASPDRRTLRFVGNTC